MSHELVDLLNAIIGYSELLEEAEDEGSNTNGLYHLLNDQRHFTTRLKIGTFPSQNSSHRVFPKAFLFRREKNSKEIQVAT